MARTAAGLRLQMHQRDPDFKRYVDGEMPWPDELEEGFVARCSCDDRCLYHDIGRGTLEDDCNCDKVCGQHGAALSSASGATGARPVAEPGRAPATLRLPCATVPARSR